MNIFEIFSAGKGKINEENMSSVLGFLLDPMSPHGFGRESLGTFLEPIENDIKKLIDKNTLLPLARKGDGIRVLLSQTQRIDIEFERACITEDPNAERDKRRLDLVISLYDKDSKIKLVIAIENKIRRDASIDKFQLIEEYLSLRSEVDPTIPIIFIYITPDVLINPSIDLLWNNFSENFDTWKGKYHNDLFYSYGWREKPILDSEIRTNYTSITTVYKFAADLLNKERQAKINPVSSHSDLLLRSMLRFIEQNFRREELRSENDHAGTDYSTNFLNDDDEFWREIKNDITKKFALNIKDKILEILNPLLLDHEELQLKHYVTKNRYALFAVKKTSSLTKFSPGRIFTIRSDGRTKQVRSPVLEMYFNTTDHFECQTDDPWKIETRDKGVTIFFETPNCPELSAEIKIFLINLAKNALGSAKNEF